jgi:hypothetical protein
MTTGKVSLDLAVIQLFPIFGVTLLRTAIFIGEPAVHIAQMNQ